MISINVKSNLDAVLNSFIASTRKQALFATAKALTDTAKAVRLDIMAEMPKQIDKPTPYTLRGVGYRPANKTTLTAVVFLRDVQAVYLSKLIKGGTERPKAKAFFVPEGVRTDRYGNIPRNEMRKLRGRKDVFSSKVNGVPGLWQRTGSRGLRLLVRYDDERQTKASFDFYGIGRKSVAKHWPACWAAAWVYAQATTK
jgi:hypothetical protein